MQTAISRINSSISVYYDTRMLAILSWAIACGIPLLLLLSTLSARLVEAGVPLSTIGMFSAVTLPYSLKFFGAPIVERIPIPILSRFLGRARAWMVVCMIGVAIGLIWMGTTNPNTEAGLTQLFWASFFTCFCAAMNDIAEAEVRIELVPGEKLSPGMACYTTGYRIGMMFGGGLALILAQYYSWFTAYAVLACMMSLGIIAVILQPHNKRDNSTNTEHHDAIHYTKNITNNFLKRFSQWNYKLIIAPAKNYMSRPGWLLAFIIIMIYYYSEDILLMMGNPFYLSIGIDKATIGFWSGTIGVIMVIIGGTVGGLLCRRFGSVPILFICGIFHMLFTLILAIMAHIAVTGVDAGYLSLIFKSNILFSQLLVGVSGVAFMTTIASRCKVPYTATQNAILTSAMALAKIIFASTSGFIVTQLDWQHFFIYNTVIVLPILLTIFLLHKTNKKHNLVDN